MNTEITASANAKINLFLRVCGKYDNGYHRLLMLMQKISLSDKVIIKIDDSKEHEIEVDCEIKNLDMKKNLCYKAADKFYEELSKKKNINKQDFPYITIKLEKVTPSEAGLGGGSSDAATVIKELNKYHENPFDMKEMIDMGSQLGADVPFFFEEGSTFCEGIGEILTPVPSLAGLNMVLVKPQTGVATGPCFKLCDEYFEAFDEDKYKALMSDIFTDSSLTPLDRIKKAAPFLTNDLQKPAVEINSDIGIVIEEVKATNPVFSMMSGSGSAVFAIYEDEKDADFAINELKVNCKLEGCLIIPICTTHDSEVNV